MNGDVSYSPSVIYTPVVKEKTCGDFPEVDTSKSLTLTELINIGLENNPTTKYAWANAKAAAFAYYASKSLYLPNVNLQEDGVSEDTKYRYRSIKGALVDTGNVGGLAGYSEYLSSTLSVQYLLFDFGTRSATVQSAKDALLSSNWEHQFTLQQVIYNVCKAYYDELEAKAFILSSTENLANAKTSMDSAEAQFNAGIKTKVDLLQAKANYLNAQLDLENRKANEKVTRAKLAQTIGLAANVPIDVDEIPFKIEPKDIQEGIDTLIETARLQRADLAGQEALVMQKQANIDIAIGNALPTLSFDATFNQSRFTKSPLVYSHDYAAALVLDIPIFQGFSDYNSIREAKAEYESAYYSWRNSEELLLVEVITAYTQYVTANTNLTTSEEYLQFAEESFNGVLLGYNEGIQTIVDLLSAQNVLADARARQIQARASWLRAIVNIAFTTGLLGINAEELSISTNEIKGKL